MAVTETIFRADYPEFSAKPTYPTSLINYYINFAALLLNPDRWDDTKPSPDDPNSRSMRDVGIELLIAHNITLRMQQIARAKTGAPPAGPSGPVSSKSLGPASTSFDTNLSGEAGAGHWNLTVYGQEFYKLIKLLGAGPFQLNIGIAPWWTQGAWVGPWPWPLPSGSGFSS